MLVTSGLLGHDSSASAALQRSLENRLMTRLDTAGSTLFKLTWRGRTTPLGRRYLERAASVRRTSGKGCTSVPTPNAMGGGQTSRSGNRKGELLMGGIAQLATVPTPQVADTSGGGQAKRAMGGKADTLHSQTNLCSVASPSARDWKDTSGMSETGVDPDGSIRTRLDQLPRQAQLADSGLTATGGTPATKSIGQLDPAYSRWLQGLPAVFCDCGVMATALCRKSRKRS
jgi:hypothetical protein